MALDRLISTGAAVVTLPLRIAGQVVGGVMGRIRGRAEDEAPQPRAGRRRPGPDPQRSRAPKPLDDVAITRKVESVIFRQRGVQKGKIDVNTAEGVVWLRGEAKTPDLIKTLERRTREVPEVKRVENLLHLPKTPAPSRTDTPASQRKTRRTKPPRTTRKG
jgi:osmotically-inducible protein OsmY